MDIRVLSPLAPESHKAAGQAPWEHSPAARAEGRVGTADLHKDRPFEQKGPGVTLARASLHRRPRRMSDGNRGRLGQGLTLGVHLGGVGQGLLGGVGGLHQPEGCLPQHEALRETSSCRPTLAQAGQPNHADYRSKRPRTHHRRTDCPGNEPTHGRRGGPSDRSLRPCPAKPALAKEAQTSSLISILSQPAWGTQQAWI